MKRRETGSDIPSKDRTKLASPGTRGILRSIAGACERRSKIYTQRPQEEEGGKGTRTEEAPKARMTPACGRSTSGAGIGAAAACKGAAHTAGVTAWGGEGRPHPLGSIILLQAGAKLLAGGFACFKTGGGHCQNSTAQFVLGVNTLGTTLCVQVWKLLPLSCREQVTEKQEL